jgi:adenylate cyclase
MRGLLFIDDEEGVRRSIERALRREPYTVHTAESGEAGIHIFKENRFGIGTVVTDYIMPGMDGLETLRHVTRLNPEVTRILLTGYATLEAAVEATNQGLDGFLTKPFENVELRLKIRDITLRKRLRQFVPHQVYEKMADTLDVLTPTIQEATILFMDIRGFSEIIQKYPATEVAAFLNDQYFTPMGEIIYSKLGMIDKHLGDGIMAIFGLPISNGNDAQMALSAAIELQQKAREINHFQSSRPSSIPLKTGIGIATGKILSGVFGSIRKKEFTAVGPAVNLAARLEKMAGEGEILLCPSTYQKIKDCCDLEAVVIEEQTKVSIRGMGEIPSIFRLMDRRMALVQ